MKKICFVKYDMQVPGGGERVCANLANALSDKCKVHVVSICSESDESFYRLDEEVNYRVLIHGSCRIRENFFKGVRLLKEYIKENDIDMVFAVGVSVNPFVMFAVKGTACKAISCEHSTCLDEFENDLSQRICRRLGAHFADMVLTVTPTDAEAYIEKYNLNPERVTSIYNWIDDSLLSDQSSYNPSSKIILSASRIVPIKGIENMIEVSKRLKEEFPDWQWRIYGDGDAEYVKTLQNEIDKNDLGSFIKLMGGTSDIYNCYRDCGLFVLTSYSESFSMVLLEAKANWVPLISFDCPTGPRNIIRDGVDGYLVKPNDLDELHDRMYECMSDEELRKTLSANAYGNIDKFSKNKIIKMWLELIGA